MSSLFDRFKQLVKEFADEVEREDLQALVDAENEAGCPLYSDSECEIGRILRKAYKCHQESEVER